MGKYNIINNKYLNNIFFLKFLSRTLWNKKYVSFAEPSSDLHGTFGLRATQRKSTCFKGSSSKCHATS